MYLLNRHTVTLLRSNGVPEYNEDGDLIPAEREPFTIKGCMQPFRKRNSRSEEQLVLPENVRLEDVKVFYTKFELRPASNFSNIAADVVQYRGDVYEVFSVWDFSDFPLAASHYAAVLIRRDKINV
jgi:hypothetical protein